MKEKTKQPKALVGIPVKEVITMVKTYHAYSMRHPDYPTEKYHVKCVWFPIDRITEIYNRLVDEGADGLRIYLGRYPADVSDFEDPKPEPNTNSVILVSTGFDADGNIAPKMDYFVDFEMIPQNRGEQCQPTCDGVTVDPPND